MADLTWKIKRFHDLTLEQLYGLLRLRTDVFVVEQNCPYPELDGKDTHGETLHIMAVDPQGRPAGYLRILGPGVSYEDPSFGRVVVQKDYRGRGLSHELVDRAVAEMRRLWPGCPITIGAQAHLETFYGGHGFVTVTESYLEDGIPHIDMTRTPVSRRPPLPHDRRLQ